MLAVVLACRPVAAVAATQALAVGKLAGSLHIDESDSKLITRSILVEEHIYIESAIIICFFIIDSYF